nr:hypothetical protein [Tanacetum cinerariifolium]
MTRKLDDIIELPMLQPNRTYNEDLECEIVMVKMPKCMSWLDDELIGDLDTIGDKAKNPSPQSTPQEITNGYLRTWNLEEKEKNLTEPEDGVMINPDGVARKAHLLEDKQIPSVGVFDEVSFYTLFQALEWILEEIHMIWAHLEKKQTRLRLYTKSLKKLCIQNVETASRVSIDDVRTIEMTASEMVMASKHARPKETIEDFVSRD